MMYREITSCPFCGIGGPWGRSIQPIVKKEEIECYGRNETRYSLCKCGGHFQNPMPTDATLEEIYRSTYRAIHPHLLVDDRRPKRIFPYLPQTVGSMLDVGCSRGGLIRLAKSHGWQVAGVEPNEDSGRQAEQIGIIYRSLDDVDRTFDLVSAIHVLEHVPDPMVFLAQMTELVNPGGEMLVVVPYYNYRPPHLLAMGGEQVQALFARVGIEKVNIQIHDVGEKQDVVARARLDN